MKKAFKEIGTQQAFRYGYVGFILFMLRFIGLSPVRVLILRMLGAFIGKDVILSDIRFTTFYRHGLRKLHVGDSCFVGDEVLFDLGEAVTLEDHSVISHRVMIFTHTNIGYADHPLTRHIPASYRPVVFKRGCYLGAGAIVLPGVTIGEEAVVGAGSVVTKDVPSGTVVAGVPARIIKELKPAEFFQR